MVSILTGPAHAVATCFIKKRNHMEPGLEFTTLPKALFPPLKRKNNNLHHLNQNQTPPCRGCSLIEDWCRLAPSAQARTKLTQCMQRYMQCSLVQNNNFFFFSKLGRPTASNQKAQAKISQEPKTHPYFCCDPAWPSIMAHMCKHTSATWATIWNRLGRAKTSHIFHKTDLDRCFSWLLLLV